MTHLKQALLILICLLAITGTCFGEESRYDFDCQNTRLADTLYVIAQRAGRDVVINGKLDGVVLSSLKQKTVDEAMDILSKTFNFNWMLSGNAILISPADSMLQNKRFIVNYADLKLVQAELVALSIPDKSIGINPQYNAITVSGTPYMLQVAEQRIKELDVPVQQCLIVAQMIAISKSDELKLGIQYTMPIYNHAGNQSTTSSGSSSSGATTGGSVLDQMTYTVTSAANDFLSHGTVIARPSVLTFNGQEASLSMGDQVPILSSTSTTASTDITVTYKDVGNKLKVTPQMSGADSKMVTLKISTEVSSISKYVTQGNVVAPQISTRSADTLARVKSGQTLVIGGLMTQSDIENLTGIPGLMDLPILGKLFQYRERTKDKSDVFVLITPYIIDDGTTAEQMQKILQADAMGKGKP